MTEHLVIRANHRLGYGHWDSESDPVFCRGTRDAAQINIMGKKPLIDCREGRGMRGNELLDFASREEPDLSIMTRLEILLAASPLGQVLPIASVSRVTDLVELINKFGNIELLEANFHGQQVVGGRRRVQLLPSSRNGYKSLLLDEIMGPRRLG